MAISTYTVKRGDSLWVIANGSRGANIAASISGNTTQAKVNTLVALNGLSNPDLIYPGQILKLSGSSSSPSSSTSSKTKVNITALGLQSSSTTGRDVFATWTWSKLGNNHKNFKIRWEWDYKGETKFQESETTDTWSTFTIPKEFQATANWVQIFVKKNNKGEDIGPYWTARYKFSENPPLIPPKPNVEINKNTLVLTASISDIIASDLDATGIRFNIVRDNSTSIFTSDPVTINTTSNYVSTQYTVEPGHTYTVRACSVNPNGKESGWSDFSEEKGTKPSTPTNVTVRRDTHVDPNNDTKTYSVFLEWTAVNNADNYKVEYTIVNNNFDISGSSLPSASTEDNTPSIRIGISTDDLGYTYYFRVKAVNEFGESDPSSIVELPVGAPPDSPSTWSTSDSAFVGEIMELNWTHNPRDNSKQTYAQLALSINDGTFEELEVMVNSTDVNDTEQVTKDYTYGTSVSYKGTLYFKMDTNHPDLKNAKIKWKVRTAGVTDIFSNESWSVERTIYIYEKPSLYLSMTSDLAGNGDLISTLTSFPFYIRGQLSLASYDVQRPVGYHLQIISEDYYVTVDDIGRTKIVNSGDAIYSKYFSTSDTLIVEMSASNIDLEPGVNYIVYCTVDMSTGLAVSNGSNPHRFDVNWVDVEYSINADISVNTDSYTALITPYCGTRILNNGEKNIIPYPYYDVGGSNHQGGLNWTDVGDGSIIVNGTVEKNADGTTLYASYIFAKELNLISNNYYSFSSNSGRNCLLFNYIDDTGTTKWIAEGTPVLWRDTYTFLNLYVQFQSGDTLNNLILKPQLEMSVVPTSYEPYIESYDLVENITLSVYRREYDGTYTEIASDIPNNYTSVTDPHPALDYARYRFVARDSITGALSYWDMGGYPVNGSSVVLQWSEEWSTFDVGESTTVEGLPSYGSLLKLPYNIKVTDKRNTDVSLVKYAGRKRPVSYYGTHIDESSQWTVEIPADDKDTIYALRRLSLWTGDVYVREPSGMGYWASVNVSFSKAYNDVTIPISLDITRVEGGV